MVKFFILSWCWICRVWRVSWIITVRADIVNETENKREGKKERNVGEEDVEVGLENGGEHVDVKGNWSIGHYPHKTQVQLNSIKQNF